MDRVAVFVDAGYVFAQGSVLLAGRKLPRGDVSLAHDEAVKTFAEFATKISGVPLLRVYWYDGTSTGPTAQHHTLAHLQDVKVRLGFVNSVGEQKGVDSLIVTDMIALARNRAISDAVLVSGDEDLRVGVQQAQEFGVRVHLVGIKPGRGSQSLFLLQEADTTQEWSTNEISVFLKCHAGPAVPQQVLTVITAATGTPTLQDQFEAVATRVAATLERTEIEAVVGSYERMRQVPPDIDKQLLGGARGEIGRDLDSTEKKDIRKAFIEKCRERLL